MRARPFATSPLPALIAILALAAGASPASAQPQESWRPPRLMLWYSDNLSSVTGGDDLLTLHYAASYLTDLVLKPSPWDESGWLGKAGAIGYRLAKSSLIDYPLIDFYTAVPQHEVFGHGYRAREFGYLDIGYAFVPPFPYGNGEVSSTSYRYTSKGSTPDQDLAVSMGGVEASAVMAGKLRGYWFKAGDMDYHGALLYVTTAGDLGDYLAQTDERNVDSAGSNDMLAYIKTLNSKEGRTQRQNFRMHLSRIESGDEIALLDPFLWYSYWTLLKTYLWSGGSTFRYPAIPIGPVRYLPLIGYGLTPWGPEYRFENLASMGPRVLTWRLRLGDATFHPSWGTDLEAVDLVSFLGFDLDAGLYLWKQPRLRLDPDDQGRTPSLLGGGGALNILSPVLELPVPIRLAAGGDYKTSGFVPGMNLESGIAWRIGLDISL